ncbi:PTS sugar transporter subunit IIB [Enterococcus sp. LJL99]
MIKLARIDYRLLHGQVVFSWSKALNITRIIVISDEAASDEFKKMSLTLSKPNGIILNIFSVDEVVSKMPKIQQLTDNIMMVFGNPMEANRFVEKVPGVLQEINYGVITKKEGSTQFSNAIYLNEEEILASKELISKGLHLFMQQVPTSKKENLSSQLS